MSVHLDEAINWARSRKHGILITVRNDGRPQSSDISYAVTENAFSISVTNTRAKTRNMRRDPRVVLHLSDPSTWTYLSFDGPIELSPVTNHPADQTNNQLVEYYEQVAGGPHPNWDEYRAAMIAEQRLIATFKPLSVVGQINR
jgi:PPOX class probable F420-dependent enzyme